MLNGLIFLAMSFVISFSASGNSFNINPQYVDTSLISVGVSHVCAYTTIGIKCFGNSEDTTLKSPINFHHPRMLSTGNRFSCMIVNEGIRCWGEIPNTNKTDILLGPKKIYEPKLLSVGYEHACAVNSRDQILCWGRSDSGEGSAPTGLKKVTELSLGMDNSCAIADGKVVCWGAVAAGSGDIPSDLKNPRNLTSGWWHHCVQSDDGIKCWGYPFKESVPPNDSTIKEITSGGFFNCAIVTSGVLCWDESGKTDLVEESVGAIQLSVGPTNACAVTEHKGVICWSLVGKNKLKLLKSFVPSGGVKSIEKIAAGNSSTCVYGDQDVLKCWGLNSDGALNVPDTIRDPVSVLSLGIHKTCAIINSILSCWGDRDSTYSIPANIGPVTMVSSGGYQICAGTTDKITCWGDDVRDGLQVPKNLNNISQISSGFMHVCAVSNNEVVCWGGSGVIKGVNPYKKIVNPKAICAGGTFSCAIAENGKINCWGEKFANFKEIVSDNNVLKVPKEINNAIEISCGLSHACAIYNGKIKCWGNGEFSPDILTPKVTIKNPKMISAGLNHTCAVGNLGLSCWGDMLNMDMPNYSLEK